jgi:hypothetical protein
MDGPTKLNTVQQSGRQVARYISQPDLRHARLRIAVPSGRYRVTPDGCRTDPRISTFMGKTTMHLAANSPPDAKVYTLDLPQENFEEIKKNLATYDESLIVNGRKPVGFHYRRSPWADKIEQLFVNSMAFDKSKYAGQMDFVLVDADHYYPSVVNDTRKAMAMLSRKPGSMVLWHDLRPKTDAERGIIDVVGKQGVFKIEDTILGIYRV